MSTSRPRTSSTTCPWRKLRLLSHTGRGAWKPTHSRLRRRSMRSSNLLIAAFGLAIAGICYGAPASNDALKREVVQRYEITPLAFSENRGQAPRGVDYVSSGLGHRILVRRSGVEIYTATGRSSESDRKSVQF